MWPSMAVKCKTERPVVCENGAEDINKDVIKNGDRNWNGVAKWWERSTNGGKGVPMVGMAAE